MSDTPNRVGLMQFLEGHLDFRVKLLLFVLLAAGLVYGWNRMRDLEQQHRDDMKERATLGQRLEVLGSTAVTRNELESKDALHQQALAQFGGQTLEYMKQANAKIQSMTTAIGQVAGSVSSVQAQLNSATFQQHQDASTGALSGYALEESRGGKPALASVNLFYDPRQRDPNQAFRGTTWTAYAETFKPVVGDWVQDKTGGLKTTIRLSRTIARPDGTVVGTEDIPISDAATVYAPAALKTGGALAVPRWTASLGVSKDSGGRYGVQPSATIDYRVTTKYGVWGGSVNRAAAAGVSVRF